MDLNDASGSAGQLEAPVTRRPVRRLIGWLLVVAVVFPLVLGGFRLAMDIFS